MTCRSTNSFHTIRGGGGEAGGGVGEGAGGWGRGLYSRGGVVVLPGEPEIRGVPGEGARRRCTSLGSGEGESWRGAWFCGSALSG